MKNSANTPLRVIAFVSPRYSKMICGCLQSVLKYVVYTFESTLSAGTLDQFIFTKKPNNSKIVSEFRPAQAAETENKDTHHRTHWKRRWSEGRSWLVYDFDKKVMLCSLCKKDKITGINGLLPWATTGCKTIRLHKVKEYEKGDHHREAIH